MQPTRQTDLSTILTTNHPARPYLIAGGALIGVGLLRTRISGLLMLAAGTTALAKGVDEIRRVQELHGGNYHGRNLPPTD